jgi:hypothetical protein
MISQNGGGGDDASHFAARVEVGSQLINIFDKNDIMPYSTDMPAISVQE